MKMKDSDWHRNGKGDKPRTKTWEKSWQENYDDIDWSSHRNKKKGLDKKRDKKNELYQTIA
jgi:hypothetical protein